MLSSRRQRVKKTVCSNKGSGRIGTDLEYITTALARVFLQAF